MSSPEDAVPTGQLPSATAAILLTDCVITDTAAKGTGRTTFSDLLNFLATAGLQGNTLFVDGEDGDNATALRGSPSLSFQTITAAKAAAQSGDLIWVRPGTYPEANLTFNGSYWFDSGAVVSKSGGTSQDIFPSASGVNLIVEGYGQFKNSNGAVLNWSHADATLVLKGRYLSGTGGTVDGSNLAAMVQSAGNVTVDVDVLDGSSTLMPVYLWLGPNGAAGGSCNIRARTVLGANGGTLGTFEFQGTGTGGNGTELLVFNVDTLISQDGTPAWDINTTINSSTRIFINSQLIDGTDPTQSVLSILGGKVCLTAGSVRGGLDLVSPATGAEFYAAIQKLNGATNGLTTGSLRIGVLDDTGMAGFLLVGGGCKSTSVDFAIRTTNGNVFQNMQNMRLTGCTASCLNGYSVCSIQNAGVEMVGCRFDSSASTSGNPVILSGGANPILTDCVFKSNGAQKSITSSDAETVTCTGCWANNDIDSQVSETIPGGLTINANVR